MSPDEPLRLWTGTSVLTASDTSVPLWQLEDFESRFGAYVSGRTFIGVMNGDGSATSAHFGCVTFDRGIIYAVFDTAVRGSVRVNWIVVN